MDPNEKNESSEIQDVCSITLDKAPCGVRLCGFIYSYQKNFDFCNIQWRFICCLQLTDAVASVANVLHCAARTDLQMTEHTIMRLVHELTGRLNSLVRELAKAVSSPLKTKAKILVIVRKHHINNVGILCAYPTSGFEDNNTFFCCRTSVRWLQNFGRFLRRSLQLCLRNTWTTRALLRSGLKSNCCPSCLLYPSTSCPASAPRILPARSFTPCESMCMSSMCECSL